jgi:hypothetical protein
MNRIVLFRTFWLATCSLASTFFPHLFRFWAQRPSHQAMRREVTSHIRQAANALNTSGGARNKENVSGDIGCLATVSAADGMHELLLRALLSCLLMASLFAAWSPPQYSVQSLLSYNRGQCPVQRHHCVHQANSQQVSDELAAASISCLQFLSDFA